MVPGKGDMGHSFWQIPGNRKWWDDLEQKMTNFIDSRISFLRLRYLGGINLSYTFCNIPWQVSLLESRDFLDIPGHQEVYLIVRPIRAKWNIKNHSQTIWRKRYERKIDG